jgi:hypothetical protein
MLAEAAMFIDSVVVLAESGHSSAGDRQLS